MIILKTPEEIGVMAQASRVVAETLKVLQKAIRPGITTDELDRLAEEEIRSRGARPAFKGYRNYPKTLCRDFSTSPVAHPTFLRLPRGRADLPATSPAGR